MLTIAYLNNILLHAEFSPMDYTLNIVSKCRFFFISKHLRAPKRSWKIFHGVLESPGFFVSKRVGTLINTFCTISLLLGISFVQYPSSDIKLPNYLNWLTCSTCCPSTNINFQCMIPVSAYAHHLRRFHINLHTKSSGDLIRVIH